MCQINLDLPLSPCVTVSGSTLEGWAIHETLWNPGVVRAVGSHSERWRFKHQAGSLLPHARAKALAEWHLHDDVALVEGDGVDMLVLNEHFPEVPPHAVLEPIWNRVFSAPRERKAPIHVKEGLCPLWGLRRCANK